MNLTNISPLFLSCNFISAITHYYDIYILKPQIWAINIKAMLYIPMLNLFMKVFAISSWNSYFLFIENKINTNESIWHWASFFWTYPTYLFLFVWMLFFLSCCWTLNHISWKPLLFLLYFNEILYNTFFVLNSLNYYQNNFNFFLINFLNKYHPFLFYLNSVLFFFIIKALLTVNFIHKPKFYLKAQATISLNFKIYQHLIIITCTLFFGSWWAFQEASWGGWWNWDFSEVFGAIFMLTAIFTIHLSRRIYLQQFLGYFLFNVFFLITVSYLFLQLNFKISSHNFGEKFFFFYNNNFFFTELIFISCCWWVKCWLNKFRQITQNSYFCFIVKRNFSPFYSAIILHFLMLFLFFISFSPVLNNFWWLFFNQKFPPLFSDLHLLLTNIVLAWFFFYFWYFYKVYPLFFSFFNYGSFLLKIKMSPLHLLHFLVLTFGFYCLKFTNINFFLNYNNFSNLESIYFYNLNWFFMDFDQLMLTRKYVESSKALLYYSNFTWIFSENTYIATYIFTEIFFTVKTLLIFNFEATLLLTLFNFIVISFVYWNKYKTEILKI